MRLFIAINFTPDVKRNLEHTIKELQKFAVKGSFSKTDHLHLTLAFLGEVSSEKVEDILKIMERSTVGRQALTMQIDGFGKFVNHGETLYWSHVQKNEELFELQKRLVEELTCNGFAVDKKPFKPHITLARRCSMRNGFDEKAFGAEIIPVTMPVFCIHLMLSERKNGELVYSSLGEVKIEKSL